MAWVWVKSAMVSYDELSGNKSWNSGISVPLEDEKSAKTPRTPTTGLIINQIRGQRTISSAYLQWPHSKNPRRCLRKERALRLNQVR